MSGSVTMFLVPERVESGLWCEACQQSTVSLFACGLLTETGFSGNVIRTRVCERCSKDAT